MKPGRWLVYPQHTPEAPYRIERVVMRMSRIFPRVPDPRGILREQFQLIGPDDLVISQGYGPSEMMYRLQRECCQAYAHGLAAGRRAAMEAHVRSKRRPA